MTITALGDLEAPAGAARGEALPKPPSTSAPRGQCLISPMPAHSHRPGYSPLTALRGPMSATIEGATSVEAPLPGRPTVDLLPCRTYAMMPARESESPWMHQKNPGGRLSIVGRRPKVPLTSLVSTFCMTN